jgi:transcriptional regulator with XRE-family HTH domain
VEFKDILAALMDARGLSQSDISRAAEVDRSRPSEWIRGLGVPSPQALDRLADAYGLDLDHLLRVCGYRTSRPLQPADPDELELLALWRDTPPDQRGAAKQFLRFLAGAGDSSPTRLLHSTRQDATAQRARAAAQRERKLGPGRDATPSLHARLLRVFRPRPVLERPETTPTVAVA